MFVFPSCPPVHRNVSFYKDIVQTRTPKHQVPLQRGWEGTPNASGENLEFGLFQATPDPKSLRIFCGARPKCSAHPGNPRSGPTKAEFSMYSWAKGGFWWAGPLQVFVDWAGIWGTLVVGICFQMFETEGGNRSGWKRSAHRPVPPGSAAPAGSPCGLEPERRVRLGAPWAKSWSGPT